LASDSHKINKIKRLIAMALAKDRLAGRRELDRLLHLQGRGGAGPDREQRLQQLAKRLEASVQHRNRRKELRPELRFLPDLPITAKKDEIIQAIIRHPVIVVSGETGSGKTTQLPKFCIAAGRGVDGLIGCTQPRRIAATTVAHRIAEELGQELGRGVGYKIRFRDRTSTDAYIKIMTDGILLSETQTDRYLSAYDTIIVDEAHERSLNIDFVLGVLKTLLAERDDLKLIITSATIDTEKFSKAFHQAPIIEVSGRMFPVEVRYVEPAVAQPETAESTHVELAVQAVQQIIEQGRRGDMLVFMPTEQDIRETCELIADRRLKGVRVMPLYARLTASEQAKVFAPLAERKVIVATNVAETSITIPGIKYVVDSGLARISRYSPRTRTTSLPVVPVSKSSADQRKGRCGRVENGVCMRLFPEADYLSRPQFTPPEIMRANLAEVILRMIFLRLGDIAEFPFIDRPNFKHIKDGFNLLFELGAIKNRPKEHGGRQKLNFGGQKTEGGIQRADEKAMVASPDAKVGDSVVLTDKGHLMAKIPLDPRLARMLIEAAAEGCVDEMAIIAAALSIQDPRERPAQKTRETDRIHAGFNDPRSDFISLLNIWNRYHDHWREAKSNNAMKRYCREHFLSFRRMREWSDIHGQIIDILKEHGLQIGKERKPDFDGIHRSILSGFLSNIAMRKEKNIFRAARGREVMIFPGSGLFNRAGTWIVAAEIVETTRVFARTVANIDSTWLESLGKDLCKRTYLHPRWDKARGEVIASEQISLFGLIIVPERVVSYGRIDPDDAAAIFIRDALIEGRLKRPLGFIRHNQRLVRQIKSLEDRLRRKDLLVGDEEIFAFYKERLNHIFDVRTLATYMQDKANEQRLRMKSKDLLRYHPNAAELAQYPEHIDVGGQILPCSYRFEPGQDEDGVTVHVPSELAPAVPTEALDWIVPGLYKEKIAALIKGLPKAIRKKLVPIKETVEIICREMPKEERALITALGDFIYRRFGVDVPASAWSDVDLPDYLKLRIALTAADGEALRVSRDPAVLRSVANPPESSDEFESARKKWGKNDLTNWDFGDLPDLIRDGDGAKTRWIAYPALAIDPETEKKVNLRLFRHQDTALTAHLKGVAALFAIYFAKDLKFLKRQLRLPEDKTYLADYFGGAKKLEKRLFDRTVRMLFGQNIRSQKEFYSYAQNASSQILPAGQEVRAKVIAVLSAYHESRNRIYRLLQANRGNPPMAACLAELLDALARLVPETFMDIYDGERLVHLVRYVQAVAVRAERALVDLEKDRIKARELDRFSEGLERLLKSLSASVSAEKRQAIEEYFWMLEEYKVSVFAQELKTIGPISAKRLEQKLRQIERMV
jgi:ATP-dependent helicase HrpA